MHLRETDAHAFKRLRYDLLEAGSKCGLLQVLPISTEVTLQDHDYTSQSTVTASRSPTPSLSESSDIHSFTSAYNLDDLDAIKLSLSISSEERESIML